MSCNYIFGNILNNCFGKIPENFYSDNNDNIYRKCYDTCKTCNQTGNEINNNCNICINNYTFIHESFIPKHNCYLNCSYFYYFDENGKYNCTESDLCPLQYNKKIIEKKKCIDECINDDLYIYEYKYICLKECPLALKLYEDEKKCLNECYPYQFEYNNSCYNDCPNNTYRIFQNRNICANIIPENYYFDNNDNIYKECYNTCKKCNQSGNETNNNCNECKENYKFLNDSSAKQNNCYKNCEFNYFFNENSQYNCTESNLCPSQFSKLITQWKKCIDVCKNEDKGYIYVYNNNCLKKCPENMKIYEEEKECLNECYSYQFEYNNYCYNDCPKDKYKLFRNRNNCDECIPNYKFLNDRNSKLKNCYQNCNLYYFFDEAKQYFCTFSCPIKYEKLIESKGKCVDDCKNDEEYIYEFNNYCFKECPENTKIYLEEKQCLENCKSNQIEYKMRCYNELPNDTYNLFENGNIVMNNGTNFEDILNNIILSAYTAEEGKSLVIQRPDEVVYHVTNSKNELKLLKNLSNNINNISIIDLGDCEAILRKEYHINENDSLIFIKNEYKSTKVSEKKVEFEVYEPYNKTKLNLSICDETSINLYIPMELSEINKQIYEQMKESGYDMFNLDGPFYQDVCTPFDSPNGTDILLSDRIDYIYNNDDTACQSNCEFSHYSIESKYINCSCSTKKDSNDGNKKTDKFTAKKIYESFYDILKYSNYDIIKCFNIIADLKIITINIGSLIVISYFFCYLICLFIFIFRGIIPLKIKLRFELNKTKVINNLDFKLNIKNLLNPPIKKNKIHKLVLREDVERKNQVI